MFISKDVSFNEGSFPFPKLFVKESMSSNSHTVDYNYGSTSAPFVPIIASLMHIPTISLKSLPVTNYIVSSHNIVPNYTDQSPLTDKNTNQEFDHLGLVLSPDRLISESRSSHSATAPHVISQSSNILSLVNVLVSNHSYELSNSSFSSTTPTVFSYPKDNTHIELSIQNNNPEGHIYDSNWGLSNYPEGSNQLEYLTSSTYNPEESVSEQQTNTQEPNTTFCSNETSLSSCIPISYSSHFSSIFTNKPNVPLLENDHPMRTKAKTGHSKPKAYIDYTKSKATSVKQALLKPEWIKGIREDFNALQANNTWTLTTLPPNRKDVRCRWVFKLKENVDGTIQKHKVRLVANGFHQEQGFDYTETFSHVVKPSTI